MPEAGDAPGVNPADGTPEVSADGVSSDSFGLPFNTGLQYDSTAPFGTQGFGDGWVCGGLAGLTGAGGGGMVTLKSAPGRTLAFLPESAPGSYQAAWFVKAQLSQGGGGSGDYHLLSARGGESTFDATGRKLSARAPGGQSSVFTYHDSGVIASVATASDGVTSEFLFTCELGRVTAVVYKLNRREVLKTTYGYRGTKLVSVKTWENSTPGTGTPDWGVTPISAARFSYHRSGRLRHVVPPARYRQMVNNGIDPDTATTEVLNDYAASEYEYDANNRVSALYTHGRRHTYTFSYAAGAHTSSSLNVWKTRTDVTRPDGSIRSYYYNGGKQLILEKTASSPSGGATVWYRNYQRFDTLARVILTANGAAIADVDEARPELVTLKTAEGRILETIYGTNGYPSWTGLRNGSAGAPHKLREWTYESRSIAGRGVIHKVASEKVYREEGNGGAAVTSWSYAWHGSTAQVSRRTTILPAVPIAENGADTAHTRIEDYSAEGWLTASTDEAGTVTAYEYDKARGGMTRRTVDHGAGKLNLRTDYLLDDRGRVLRELGPVHEAIVDAAAVSVRTASWTHYLDREGRRVAFRGYLETADDSEHVIGPVTVTEANLPPPSGYAGWRLSQTYEAEWTGSGIPSPSATWPRADWVRWNLDLIDPKSELKEQWNYFRIPASGYGSQSVDYGKKLFGYDAAGRLNQTTCAGGTIDRTSFNAMGWPVMEETGVGAGLTVTRANQYDAEGNLTKVTLPVDGTPANDRVTDCAYDWRDRRIEEKTVVEKDGGGAWTLISRLTYDNRDLVTGATGYHTAVAGANRTSHRTTDYDVLGRPCRTKVYGVNAATGAISHPQESNTYYHPTGQVARSAPSGSRLFTAATFDAAGRTLKTFQAWEPSGFTPGSDPSDVAGAIVMEQQAMDWDAAGNLLATVSRARFDDASIAATGGLGTPTTSPQARVSCTASYADALGRPIATANYGTHGGASWTRPATVPARSDTVLVTTTDYDAAGNAAKLTDPDGMETTRAHDAADRLVTLTENAGGSGSAVRVTRYEYTDDGWLRKLLCDNSDTGRQVTEWIYGVGPATSPASALSSNRLVREKLYPGATTPVSYRYNRQLQVIGMTDQAGTAHAYGYDKLGRPVTDQIAAFGTGIDTHVGKIETAYDERGLVRRTTSYGSGGSSATVRNEVVSAYNDFDQLVTEWQEHGGAVNPSTSPKVQYSYENGSANTLRPTGITHPNGGSIATAYTDAQADALSRADAIKDGATDLCTWSYIGLSMVAARAYPAAGGTGLKYGSSGDAYAGYDRFGRIAETLWKTGTTVQVHTKYGHNRAGGVTWRRDMKAASLLTPATQDQHTWYDGLRQVERHDRGGLTPATGPPYTGITNLRQQENFAYDETGNWLSYQSYDPSLVQNRGHNTANQITEITNPSGVVQPAYDDVGNMATLPAPGDWTKAFTCQWDAWNRLVQIKDGGTVVQANSYDGLTRRIRKTTAAETRDYYFDQQWRCIEERVLGVVKADYVYDPGDRWNLIRRRRSVGGTLDEVRFVLRDFLDPAAIVTPAGTVDERYGCSAFGIARIMDANFVARAASACDWTWLFHGEFMDAETGLYNYGYRFYSPDLGRWLSRDPIGEEGGLNLYEFVGNDGLNRVDLLGMRWVPDDTTIHFVGKWKITNEKVNVFAATLSGLTQVVILFDEENFTIIYEAPATVTCKCEEDSTKKKQGSGTRVAERVTDIYSLGQSITTNGSKNISGSGSFAFSLLSGIANSAGKAVLRGAAREISAEERRLTPGAGDTGDYWKQYPCR